MTDITAAKSWTIAAAIDQDSNLTFDLGDNSIVVSEATSPVEQLLSAVGSCFVRSCAAVMQYQGMEVVGLSASVSGHKAAGPIRDKGLSKIEIGIRFEQPIDKAVKERLLRDTKSVCTVTNTLARDVEIVVSELTGDTDA